MDVAGRSVHHLPPVPEDHQAPRGVPAHVLEAAVHADLPAGPRLLRRPVRRGAQRRRAGGRRRGVRPTRHVRRVLGQPVRPGGGRRRGPVGHLAAAAASDVDVPPAALDCRCWQLGVPGLGGAVVQAIFLGLHQSNRQIALWARVPPRLHRRRGQNQAAVPNLPWLLRGPVGRLRRGGVSVRPHRLLGRGAGVAGAAVGGPRRGSSRRRDGRAGESRGLP
mmetsp:Transcript_70724/g.216780  ORF Transcript_70724/g.216780 Transcript_70724/m.216780 type:complete len:220 (-) Transcript_70724:38-697(-)